ncbi:MAG TPA: hypothetical protein VIN03_08975, partial [Roseateles sp.]
MGRVVTRKAVGTTADRKLGVDPARICNTACGLSGLNPSSRPSPYWPILRTLPLPAMEELISGEPAYFT